MDDSFITDVKRCKKCNRLIPKSYESDYCNICSETELFDKVKEYIRNNNVREIDVAEQFNIPVAKVHEWVRSGKIQYRDMTADGNVRCCICNTPIKYGSYCSECVHLRGLAIVAEQHRIEKEQEISKRMMSGGYKENEGK